MCSYSKVLSLIPSQFGVFSMVLLPVACERLSFVCLYVSEDCRITTGVF